MRIIAISDIHGHLDAAEKLGRLIDELKPDLVLLAGDITNFGSVEAAGEILEAIGRGDVEMMFVPGNCDPRLLSEVDEFGGAYNIHGMVQNFSGMDFIGLGGSGPTPFKTPNELSEEEVKLLLSRLHPSHGAVILSHQPPHDTDFDRVFIGGHVGSRVLRGFIEDIKPRLVVVGHIHEARGMQRLLGSLLLNPGPGFKGFYGVVEFEADEVKADLLRL